MASEPIGNGLILAVIAIIAAFALLAWLGGRGERKARRQDVDDSGIGVGTTGIFDDPPSR